MKIGFDIGGVLSKYPSEIIRLINILGYGKHLGFDSCDFDDIFFITDQHPKSEVVETIWENGLYGFPESNIYCADYYKYGNMAKAILIRDLGIHIFIDDFDGYLQWDNSLGPQPLLLKVMPDAFKPYWADSWKCNGGDFGRRKYVHHNVQ